MASGNEKDSPTFGHPSTSYNTIMDEDKPCSENYNVSHTKSTNQKEHSALGIEKNNLTFPKPNETFLDEKEEDHLNKEKIDLSIISVTLAECKINNTVEPVRTDHQKFRGDLRNTLKLAHSDEEFNDKFAPMLNKVARSAFNKKRNKIIGMSKLGLAVKSALQKYNPNSELNAAFSNENGDAKIAIIEEGGKSPPNKNKAVKFNPEVQVIYCIKKAINSEVVLNTVEILNKETDQQARNHHMRKSYSLGKLNTFLF